MIHTANPGPASVALGYAVAAGDVYDELAHKLGRLTCLLWPDPPDTDLIAEAAAARLEWRQARREWRAAAAAECAP